MPAAFAPPRHAYLVPLCLLTVGALAACGSGNQSAATTSGKGDPRTVAVTVTDQGCTPDRATVDAGALTFHLNNTNATAVSEVELRSDERILGEKENLAPGFTGTFALNLNAGSYTIYCPGAKNERTTLTVTGKAASSGPSDTAGLLSEGATQYAGYIKSQTALLAQSVKPLTAAISGGDLAAAKQAYAKARPYYERVEPVAESFTSGADNLDSDIDAREGDVPASQWKGFHRIEKGLFTAGSTQGLAPVAQELESNVNKLVTLVAKVVYQPAELANGAVELLDEVAKTKVTGEEERYSHIDLLDFQANVEGSEQAYAGVSAGLKKIDPTLAATISSEFAAVDKLLDGYRQAGALGGFTPYGQLKPADVKQLSQAVHTVAEPLSRVASKLVNS